MTKYVVICESDQATNDNPFGEQGHLTVIGPFDSLDAVAGLIRYDTCKTHTAHRLVDPEHGDL